MANPNGALQGYTDPEMPGWQERALQRVRERQRKSERNHRRPGSQTLHFDLEFKALLDAAAHERNISLSGYSKRAVAAFIAHDLGLPLEEVVKHMSRPAPYGLPYPVGKGQFGSSRSVDDGEGYGDWSIER